MDLVLASLLGMFLVALVLLYAATFLESVVVDFLFALVLFVAVVVGIIW